MYTATCRNLLLIAFGASLAINALCVPMAVGTMFGHRLPALLQRSERAESNVLASSLTPERRKEVRALIRSQIVPEIRDQAQQGAALRTKLADVIAKPDLKKEDLQAAFATIRDHRAKAQEVIQNQFADVILSMSPDERKNLADGIAKNANRREDAMKQMDVIGK